MLKAVIFDFDGVITDSEILHFRSFNQVLAPFDINISKADYYKSFLGLSDFDVFDKLIGEGALGVNCPTTIHLTEKKNKIFNELAKQEGSIIPGVRDFLLKLQQNKIPMAICSGALMVEIQLILEDANLADIFETIVSAEQVKKGKPHPEGFQKALMRLNQKLNTSIQPGDCVVIEDAHWGLDAARAAGMHTVAITNSYGRHALSQAEKIIDHLDELSVDDLHQLCS